MKPPLTQTELSRLMTECLSVALSALLGVEPAVRWNEGGQLENAAGKLLAWSQALSGGVTGNVQIVASSEDWTRLGKFFALSAGLDESSDPLPLCGEVMAQFVAALVSRLTGLTGSEVRAADGTWTEPPRDSRPGPMECTLDSQTVVRLRPALDSMSASETTGSGMVKAEAGQAPDRFELLLDVELPVSISFGRAQLALRDVLRLSSGSIIELNRSVSEPVELIVNNCVIAQGQVVVVEGNYGLRITKIVSRQGRLRTLH